jgi:hypothetical protein
VQKDHDNSAGEESVCLHRDVHRQETENTEIVDCKRVIFRHSDSKFHSLNWECGT